MFATKRKLAEALGRGVPIVGQLRGLLAIAARMDAARSEDALYRKLMWELGEGEPAALGQSVFQERALIVGELTGNVVLALLAGIADGSHVYFVHSFAPQGTPADETLARCTHGRAFPAVSGCGRVFGTQFHPEKSGALGLRLLGNYLEMANGSHSVD